MAAEEPQQQKQEPLGSNSKGVNCLAYDEAIMAQQDRIQKEIADFTEFTIEDFYNAFMDLIEQVEKQTSLADLLASFNDQSTSDYLVAYLQLLTSGYLQRESKLFKHFIEGGQTVKEFCQEEVEPMCKESDHIHIIDLAQALSMSIQVEYMDLGSVSTMSLLIPHCQSELCHTQDPKAKSSCTMSMLQALHLDIMVWPNPITGANINSSNALGKEFSNKSFSNVQEPCYEDKRSP
ncbi:hypothetical protein U0070_017470 [Myodes glareolus]|uniref:ubiquitinyl hydrolase 1 n=1 Tax=Myodes glareolus TaxID=447135 RepID=A0AAW0HFI1_MYOGA